MSVKLDDAEVQRRLARTPEWRREGDEIVREFRFDGFDAAMDFIGEVADIARSLDHHPDLYNVYDRVVLRLTTHDAGGLTAKDFAFALAIDGLSQC